MGTLVAIGWIDFESGHLWKDLEVSEGEEVGQARSIKDDVPRIHSHSNKMAGQPPPRQPHDLEGLLKFCMQVTANEDAPSGAVEEMDPERRQWLEDAISGMTVDVVKQLAEAIKIIGGPAAFDPEASEDDLE